MIAEHGITSGLFFLFLFRIRAAAAKSSLHVPGLKEKAILASKTALRSRYNLVPMHTSVAPGARFQPASDQSLLVHFGDRITLDSHRQVVGLLRLLQSEPVAGIRNLHPAYCSLLVKFDALRLRHEDVETILRSYLDRLETVPLAEPREKEIPVCYGGDYGPDLADVCALRGMTPAQSIELHSSMIYTVYFLGFVPGFAYLGELPEALRTSRLTVPRRSVFAGSVGIAGSQTGVYPFATPGGWRLLGRTPIKMFRFDQGASSFLTIGDRVRFTPISAKQFAVLEKTQK